MMNDAQIDRVIESLPMGNPQVIQLLEAMLSEARAGRISGVVVIKAHAGQMQAATAGAITADLYVGCDLIKDSIKQQMVGRGARGGILRPM
jgi:hypothetical protein